MLRLTPRRLALGHRNLVSSALISCTWRSETIAELKNEAKRRGLSSKGRKATLVFCLEDYEKGADFGLRPTGIRRASDSATAPEFHTEVPGNPDLPNIASTSFLNLKLPDLSEPRPVPPVQVPYVPDFWNSAPAFTEAPKDEQLPKLLVVAGADTHPAGGPSHNLLDNGTTPEKPDDAPHQQHSQTLLDDISEDLGLPPVKELSARLRKLFS